MDSQIEIEVTDFVRIGETVYYVVDPDLDEQTALLVPAEMLQITDDNDSLSQKAQQVPKNTIKPIKPVLASPETIRGLFRLEVTPWKLAMDGLYPFAPESGVVTMLEEDLLSFIDNLQRTNNPLFLDAWMEWFYYSSERPLVRFKRSDKPGFTLRFLWDCVGEDIDWFDFLEDCKESLLKLKECYLKSKGQPLTKTVLPKYYENWMLDELERYAKGHPVTKEIRAYYEKLLGVLLRRKDPDDIERYAYAYYGGNGIVECNWKKSEKALLMRFSPNVDSPSGDPYCANSLGYIYYSDRLGAPDYEKAFLCFSYASQDGVIEATYKLSDMYRKGHGTSQNYEKAWDLLSTLYEQSDKKHPAKKKLPDIALRMGYCYRDAVGVDRDYNKAREFFLLAKRGIELRLKKHPGFGDQVVETNIKKALEDIEERIQTQI